MIDSASHLKRVSGVWWNKLDKMKYVHTTFDALLACRCLPLVVMPTKIFSAKKAGRQANPALQPALNCILLLKAYYV